jgi:uncharacterized protein YjbJ (UPF0337 family)
MQRVQETAMNRNVGENIWKLRWHNAIVDAVAVMDWDIVAGDWNRTKGKIKEQWSKLTNDQLDMVSGRRDELVDKIQESYGVAKYEAERQVKDWGARNDEWFDQAARRIQENAVMSRH